MFKSLALFGVGILFLATACNSAGESNGDHSPKTDTVIIKQMQFQPQELTIHPGDTVVWINEGIVAHNVAKEGEEEPMSKEIQNGGDSWSMVPDESFNYYCTIHPTMKASIKIAE